MRIKQGEYKICKCCSKEYYVPRYRVNKSSFCSVKCLNSDQYVKIIKKCERCKKEFFVSNSRIKRKYCSNDCSHFAKNDIVQNRKNQKLSARISRGKFTGKSLRKFVFSKKEKKCEICSYSEYDFCLDIHHEDKNPLNNDINNLRVLCAMCHRSVHKGIIQCQ